MDLLVNTNPFCGLCLAVPELREAMQEQDRDSTFRPGLHDMQADAIASYRTLFKIHGEMLFQCVRL